MPQAIWKGTISFGLVTIPVKLYSATEEKDISFRQVHEEDGGRIRYRRVCEIDGEEVPYSDIGKGYEMPDGRMIVLDSDDFADLPLSSKKVIDVLEFVPAEQIDPILYSHAYYLEPDAAAVKAYVLLRDCLIRTSRVAIVKVALRQREQLATLRVRGKALLLNTMLWPDEVREPAYPALDNRVETRPAELAMASALVESMATDFDPTQYTDNYRSALQAVIEAKVAGRGLGGAEPEPAAPTAVADLMAALRASVERARAARAGSDDPARAGSEPAAYASPNGAEPTAYASPNGAVRSRSASIPKRGKGAPASKTKKAPKRRKATAQ